MVPSPRGESRKQRAPIAAARSLRTSRPPPDAGRGAADAVVAQLDRQPARPRRRRAACTRWRARAGWRWRSPRPPSRTRSSRPRARSGGRAARAGGPAAAERATSACSAAASPRSDSTAGCRPRAISPSSALASIASASTSASSFSSSEPGVERAAGDAQLERERDDVLLRALVQLALEAAAELVAGLDEPAAGGGELGAGVGVDERLGQQPGEAHEPLLAARRQQLLLRGGDDQRAPGLAVQEHGSRDRALQADGAHQVREGGLVGDGVGRASGQAACAGRGRARCCPCRHRSRR